MGGGDGLRQGAAHGACHLGGWWSWEVIQQEDLFTGSWEWLVGHNWSSWGGGQGVALTQHGHGWLLDEVKNEWGGAGGGPHGWGWCDKLVLWELSAVSWLGV